MYRSTLTLVLVTSAAFAAEIPGPVGRLAPWEGPRKQSKLADRPRLSRVRAYTINEDTLQYADQFRAWSEAQARRFRPLLEIAETLPPDQALTELWAYRQLHLDEDTRELVDPMIVRLLVELDREREALLEIEQSEELQRSIQREPWLNGRVYAYLKGRMGEVWTPFWRSLRDAGPEALEYVGGRRNLSPGRCRWSQPGFVPTPADAVALAGVSIANRWVVSSPSTCLRILRRAHEAAPDDPNVKRALAHEEWRTAKDYDKALRLVREVIAVADREHVGSLKQEEGRYWAAVNYRREHGGG